MEFLGLESERGLALRIAVVPSGKDNIRGAQDRHIRAPKGSSDSPEWSTDTVREIRK